MKKAPENQMGSCSSATSSCFFRHPSISFALLTFLILSSFFSSLLFSTLLTFSVLVLSTVVLLTFTKKKQFLEENPMEAEFIDCGREKMPELEPCRETQLENEVIAPETETEESHMGQILADVSSTSGSDSDDWLDNVGQIPALSDCSISDDESLIEIALSDECHFSPEEHKQICGPNLPESVFQQHGLMELLSEINEIIEEDNLIEIDINVGSIKCSSLEIIETSV